MNPFTHAVARLGTDRADRRVIATLLDDDGLVTGGLSWASSIVDAIFPNLHYVAAHIEKIGRHGEWLIPVPVEVLTIVSNLGQEFAWHERIEFDDTECSVSIVIRSNPVLYV